VKLLLILLILYVFYRLFLRFLPGLIRLGMKGVLKKGGESRQGEAHDMAPCSRCGTYMSRDLALAQSGEYYCSEKCRNEGSTIAP